MSIALAVLALGLPTLAAAALIARADPEPARTTPTIVLRIGLSVLLGPGMGSVLAYGWLLVAGGFGSTYPVLDVLIFAVVASIALRGLSRRAPSGPPAEGHGIAFHRAGIAAAFAGTILLGVTFAVYAAKQPHGAWDAWAIWNQRARFLLRAGDAWRLAFSESLAYSHPGYPLALPLSVARVWAFTGESTLGPLILAGLHTIAPALIAFGAVTRATGRTIAGAAACLMLAATDSWMTWGASQYADIPLAAYIAAAGGLLALWSSREGRGAPALLAMAGAFLGLAGWMKDEGLVIAGIFVFWLSLRAPRAAFRNIAALGAGAILPALARVHFQIRLAPGFAEVFTREQTTASVTARLLDGERWATVLALAPGDLPGIALGLPVVAIAMAGALGARPRDLLRSPVVLPVIGSYAAYLVVYALTPIDLAWHIANSAPRVLVQPWPAYLLGVMATAGCARSFPEVTADPRASLSACRGNSYTVR